MFARAARRAAATHAAALEQVLITGRAAGGGGGLGPLLLCCLPWGAGSAWADEANEAPSRAASGQYVDVPMHGKILNVRVDVSLGDGGQQPAAGDAAAADVTTRSRYVIVGYGVAGSAALKAVLEVEPEAEVLVIENDQASKEREDLVPLRRGRSFLGFCRQPPASVRYMWGTSVTSIDVDNKVLVCSNGERVGYGKVLLAMGAGPMEVPARHVDDVAKDRVMQVQSHADREALAELVAAGQHVTLLGSCWNAVELANHLSDVARQHGWSSSVTLLFPEGAPMAKQLPRSLAGLLQRRLERRGVEVIPHTSVKYVGRALDWDLSELGRTDKTVARDDGNGPIKVYLCSKFESLDTGALLTDRVVLVGSSIQGTRPALDFHGNGLELDDRTGAVVVNHELNASSSVLVAGDAAHFPCRTLGRMTLRSVDHSYHSGYVAGLNLAGRQVRYSYMPIYFGAIPRLGVRAALIGNCDAGFETHGFWWRNGRRMQREATEVEPEVVKDEGESSESLTDRVKGGLKRALEGPDLSTASSPSEANAGRGVLIGAAANRDSHVGRKLGMRRFTTEREAGPGGIRRAGTQSSPSFTPIHGTGVVFYVDGAGAIRGVLLWGVPCGGDEGAVEVMDGQLSGMVHRVKGLISQGVEEGVVFKYDMNSRPDTVSNLRALALDVVRPEAFEAISNKVPLYSYASARLLANSGADDPIFRASTNSKSSSDILSEAYDKVVKRNTGL